MNDGGSDGGSRSARGSGAGARGSAAGGASYGDLGMTTPHPARMYDFYLGGKTNYAVDRESANKVTQIHPQTVISARHNRWFMHRATRFLAGEVGIGQFLDVGTGIPTEPNLHQVAQSIVPEARVVYVDNDPIVLTFARALLSGTSEGATDYVEADVREPARILERAAWTLDFDRPAALSLVALLHFIGDADEPHGLVRRLMEPFPSGSALVISHGTSDFVPKAVRDVTDLYGKEGITVRARVRDEVARFFEQLGLDLVEPGLVPSCDWRTELEPDGMVTLDGMVSPEEVSTYAAVGIKP